MARRVEIFTVTAEGRDKGKSFLLTEMPPRQAEKWANRALLAFAKSGKNDMPDEFKDEMQRAGMAGIAAIGLRAITTVDFADAEPLLDEMMTCVTFIPDLSKTDQMSRQPISRPMIDDDIEEVATIYQLRSEVIELHLGFSVAAILSRVGAAAKKALLSMGTSTSPKA
jgi:hypothetical protein